MNPMATLVARVTAICVLAICAAGGGTGSATAPLGAESDIREVLAVEAAAWNRGDLDAFMLAYHKSDETEFVGANGVTRGWQAVMDRYHQRYPDRKAMGNLSFSNVEVHMVCAEAGYVIGQFQLERESDKPAGVFTLNFRKYVEGWKIVADHSTAFASAGSAVGAVASGPTAGAKKD